MVVGAQRSSDGLGWLILAEQQGGVGSPVSGRIEMAVLSKMWIWPWRWF